MQPTAYPHPTPSQLRQRAAGRRLKKLFAEEFGSNQVDVYVLQTQEVTDAWVSLQKAAHVAEEDIADKYLEITGVTLDGIRNYSSSAGDAVVLARLGADMQRSGNIFGTYRVIQRGGKQLLVFRGWPGLRRHLNAPVYGLKNPKIVKMGVGVAGAQAMLRSAVLVTIIISPAIRTIEWFFVDNKATLESVLARSSTDIVKGIVAAGAGYFASTTLAAMAGTAVVAVAPIAMGIGVAISVGLGLEWVDNRLGITDQLISALVSHHKEWKETKRQIDRDANYYFFTSKGSMEFIHRFFGNRRGFHSFP